MNFTTVSWLSWLTVSRLCHFFTAHEIPKRTLCLSSFPPYLYFYKLVQARVLSGPQVQKTSLFLFCNILLSLSCLAILFWLTFASPKLLAKMKVRKIQNLTLLQTFLFLFTQKHINRSWLLYWVSYNFDFFVFFLEIRSLIFWWVWS